MQRWESSRKEIPTFDELDTFLANQSLTELGASVEIRLARLNPAEDAKNRRVGL